MSVFSRLSEIVASNLNALLDRAEDPELLLRQFIHEMEEGLGAAKRHAATVIATERRLGRELEWNRGQAEVWKTRAKHALAAGREDLAREAVAHKLDHDALVRDLIQQHSVARDTSNRVRSALGVLEHRLTDARGKQRSLVARNRAAKVRAQASERVQSGVPCLASPQSTLSRIEDRLQQREEELIAYAELNEGVSVADAAFFDLERERAIDAELEALEVERKND
jgi:phage shock protein A